MTKGQSTAVGAIGALTSRAQIDAVARHMFKIKDNCWPFDAHFARSPGAVGIRSARCHVPLIACVNSICRLRTYMGFGVSIITFAKIPAAAMLCIFAEPKRVSPSAPPRWRHMRSEPWRSTFMVRRKMAPSASNRCIALEIAHSGPLDHDRADQLHGRVSAQQFDELMQKRRAAAPVRREPD